MKAGLRIAAVLVLLGALGYWWAAGANRGWTKTSIPHKSTDEVTGIEGVTYEKRFVPGVDLLTAAAGCAVVLGGLSLLFRTKKPGTTAQPGLNIPHP